jgi:hypothetical protein
MKKLFQIKTVLAAAMFLVSVFHAAAISTNITISALPAGKSVRVIWQTTINASLPAGVAGITNQGTVSGANFTTVATDDPTVGGATDPTITLVSVPPIVSNRSKTGTEDTVLSFNAADFFGGYTDANGDPFVKIQITSLPANGTLKVSSVNVTNNQEVLSNSIVNITFVPATNFFGTTTFNWKASDGTYYSETTALMTLTITNVNDAPTAVADTLTANMNTAATISAATLVANDTDPDGDALTVSAVVSPSAAGGTVSLFSNIVTYQPATNFFGTDSFTYKVSDAKGGTNSGTVAVTVLQPNAYRLSLQKTNSIFRLSFIGVPGQSYNFQASTNLGGSWTNLFTNVLMGGSGVIVTNDTNTTLPFRFYRVGP